MKLFIFVAICIFAVYGQTSTSCTDNSKCCLGVVPAGTMCPKVTDLTKCNSASYGLYDCNCVVKYYNSTGGEVCRNTPTCGCTTADSTCPIGTTLVTKTDTAGCTTCNCESTCPVIDCTTVKCAVGYKIGTELDLSTGCKRCACVNDTCIIPDCSTKVCDAGYITGTVRTSTGCEQCSCVPYVPTCPTTNIADCSTTTVCSADSKLYTTIGKDGCKVCSCVPIIVCPQVACLIGCPNGAYEKDPVTGCQTCKCACPDYLSSCADLRCPYGYVRDSTGCPTCKCVTDVTTCPDISTCNFASLNCTSGFYVDSNNCKFCKCSPTCANTACDTTTNLAYGTTVSTCTGGYVLDTTTGCPTCTCTGCTRKCSLGYVRNADGSPSCDCVCPAIKCANVCPSGKTLTDIDGCPTCDCVPDCSTRVMCDLRCPYGYVKDSTGCDTCNCVTKPVCDAPICDNKCEYGYQVDSNGCSSCKCNPCPEVACLRYCEYGFAVSATGCPSCTCNTKPPCETVSTTDASFVRSCALNCTYYKNADGCPTCTCDDKPPCTCGAAPTEAPKKCLDGSVPTYVCKRDYANNVCTNVPTPCPIGIVVKVEGELTLADLNQIALDYKIDPADIKLDITKEGSTTVYTVWIKSDALPASVTGNVVADSYKGSGEKKGLNTVAYVITDTSASKTGSAASVIVSLLAIAFAMLM